MKELKKVEVPCGVYAICEGCGMPSIFDHAKDKWICTMDDCKKEFDWIRDGVIFRWPQPRR
ncbi:MAG: hypothetical protein A2469_00390 [Candidatus Magasanikbacteria bacterium RIFOXYC2_FULL_40_16]|uniref:Uncharacterized protein n=3 Tax=Candidatus Magasanikiibacteriota TaxID=1752731 RepID=A0A1F6NGX7_9BACT|nr:MAG: hypothetical protein A2373_01750 [Candidatus Magasanikbacteria bacterium RIFOXYB1_FULL_40_15]OGH86817.1 MAG: hypothetical protein A2301_03075 [Candidatus Magasanikbacteria bacterium RIFOXYB2_FULL_40_13]OGH87190.1 MAG: hypothetical protein A2206_00320 [Candidatus Magasanikbacteria bacterium RIFOXYA1_FULL_40_8]OGH89548.1 MAG: hypothetical protein A2469_00390 [Candidatus Magasanikbacteria bacterium RIFOXYC2_FULL_40_16]